VRILSANNFLGKCGRKQTTNDNGIIADLQTDFDNDVLTDLLIFFRRVSD